MDVRLPNGNIIRNVPDSVSQAEVQQLAIQNGLATEADFRAAIQDVNTPATPRADFRAEAARKGPAETVGVISGVGPLVEPFNTMGIPFPLNIPLRMAGFDETRRSLFGQPAPPQGTMGEMFSQGFRAGYEPVMRALGSTGAEPQTAGERILAGGITAATSPLSYIFPEISAITRMRVPAQAVARPAAQAAIGAGAEAGGQAGEYGGQKFGAPEAGRVVGSIFGGLGTSYGVGTALKTGPLAGKAWDAATAKWTKLRGMTPENEILREVDNRISNVFIAAMAADPRFEDVLSEAVKAQKGVSLKAKGAPFVQLPISSLVADNPVVASFIQQLSARDPEFRAAYQRQFTDAVEASRVNQLRLFGNPADAQLGTVGQDAARKLIVAQEKSVARQARTIDQQIADAYQRQEVDPNVFGSQIEALVNRKEQAARASTKPLYKEAFDLANQKGLTLPQEAVDDIYTFVTGARYQDIFNKFPRVYDLVERKFRPTETAPSPILTEQGAPMRPGGRQFAEASIEDLDSLKRRINESLRTTRDTDQIRFLTMLKERVSGHIDQLDPEFVTAYRNADNAYLERVGLPFNSETLRLMDRKKFVEQVAPVIIGNRSNVDDFLRATGPDGERVVRDAFYDSFSKAALKNDVIDPKAANKWLAKNSSKMAQVPGLEDELRGAVTDVQQLIARRNALNAQFQQAAGDQILSKGGFISPQELVSKMYSDINFTNKFMKQYGADKDSVNAARAFLLDDIVNANDPLTFLNDRNRAAVFNRVFGPTYAEKVKDFAVVADRLNRDISRVSFRPETVPKTPVEEMTGIPPEQILSRIFNPVSGWRYAVTSLFSKYWANQASKATEEKLKQLLLNPKDAIEVFNTVKAKESFNPDEVRRLVTIGKKYGLQWIEDAANDVVSGSARGGVQAVEEPQAMEPAQ